MNRIKKLSLLALATFSLIVSSCQISVDESPSNKGVKLDKDIAYIRLSVEKASAEPFRRTGIANGSIDFPEDFDEQFDDLNEEIAAMFYQE